MSQMQMAEGAALFRPTGYRPTKLQIERKFAPINSAHQISCPNNSKSSTTAQGNPCIHCVSVGASSSGAPITSMCIHAAAESNTDIQNIVPHANEVTGHSGIISNNMTIGTQIKISASLRSQESSSESRLTRFSQSLQPRHPPQHLTHRRRIVLRQPLRHRGGVERRAGVE